MGLNELRDYINELHIRIDYDDYLNLINMVDELDTQFNCQEDLKDWLGRNWEEIEEDIRKTVNNGVQVKRLDLSDEVDRDELIDDISENLKQGLFNVIDTFDEV